jgi:hypothetical protein
VHQEHDSQSARIARYGLPLVIAIFYLTATLTYDYTPESTFEFLVDFNTVSTGLHNDSLSPLWALVVQAGSWLQLDLLLTVKIFSLFFACTAVLFGYLFANEVMGDRLIAFSCALVAAMQPWFLQAGPAGAVASLALSLLLAALFFQMRNEYVLASVLSGVLTLIAWPGVLLMGFIVIDLVLNSRDKRRGVRFGTGCVMVYCSVLLPWFLYAFVAGRQFIPVMVGFGEFEFRSLGDWSALALLVIGCVVAIVAPARGHEEEHSYVLRNATPLLSLAVLGVLTLLGNKDALYLAMPLLIVYCFDGVARLLHLLGRQHLRYLTTLTLTVVLLVQYQTAFHFNTRPFMEKSIDRSEQIISIAYWLGRHATADDAIASEQPAELRYYTGRYVHTMRESAEVTPTYVVSRESAGREYEVVYTPVIQQLRAPPVNDHSVAVWRKK